MSERFCSRRLAAIGPPAISDLALTLVENIVPVPDRRERAVWELQHLVDGIRQGHAGAVLAASIFHYGDGSIADVKTALRVARIPVALEPSELMGHPDHGKLTNWGTAGARRAFLAPGASAMDQQYELKFVDELGDGPGPAGLTIHVMHGLPAVIDPLAWQPNRRQPRPAKAQRALIPAESTADDAFRLTLTQCKWHVVANIPAVVEAHQVEGLHQLRVGLRRMRVAFTAFGGEFRTPSMEALRLKAKQICDELAPARDLDVFLENLFEPAASANGAKEAFAVLRNRAIAARCAAWDSAVVQICAPSFSGFIRDVGKALDERIWSIGNRARSHPAKGVMAFEAPVGEIAHRMLAYRLDKAKKRARHLQKLSDADRHRLRISLKKMRYTADFFAPLYPQKAAKKFLHRLSEMQDVLGALNDVVTARRTLERLVAEGDGGPLASKADLSFAAGIVYGWQLERADRMWKDAVARWREFAHTRPFWQA